MPYLRIPTPIRPYVNGQDRVALKGDTVADAMQDLLAQFPTLRPHLTNSEGKYRPFVNLFIGEDNIRDLQGFDTPLEPESEFRLVPSIAGG